MGRSKIGDVPLIPLREVNIGCSSEAEDEATVVAAYPNGGSCDEDGNCPPHIGKQGAGVGCVPKGGNSDKDVAFRP